MALSKNSVKLDSATVILWACLFHACLRFRPLSYDARFIDPYINFCWFRRIKWRPILLKQTIFRIAFRAKTPRAKAQRVESGTLRLCPLRLGAKYLLRILNFAVLQPWIRNLMPLQRILGLLYHVTITLSGWHTSNTKSPTFLFFTIYNKTTTVITPAT